jgi:hypothetical protein
LNEFLFYKKVLSTGFLNIRFSMHGVVFFPI